MGARLALAPTWPAPTCSICGDAPYDPAHWENELARLCVSCCGAVHELIRAESPESVARIWGLTRPERSASAQAIDELTHDDVTTHGDLGLAYLEMGLTADAFEEALIAARGAKEHYHWHRALEILFSAEIAPGDLFGRLEDALREDGA